MNDFGNYAEIIDELHKDWSPHDGQITCGKALFQQGKRNLFIQCGRKWGKTEIVIYFLYRWALSRPGSSCYYISPFQKQSKEIIWANRRLHTFIDPGYIQSINSTEMRITLTNGSFIKCDGSDNYESYRGIEPHFVVFEEFKDFRPEFYNAMEPNLAVYNAPLVIIGTPPMNDCQFTVIADEHKRDARKFFIEEPTERNPQIPKQWLSEKRTELIARGEADVWEREYMGRYVKGGASKIFPMLSSKCLYEHDKLINVIRRDLKKLKKYCWADPAGASVFGVLFVMINPYTRSVYILDELYETDQAKMTVDNIGKEICRVTDELYAARDDDDWTFGYDEAATWFANEMRDRFDINCIPTSKAHAKKEYGLSLIKDIILHGNLYMSDRCKKTYWELDNYIKDSRGNIPKVNDHNIDNLRYILSCEMYDLNKSKEVNIEADDPNFSGARISDDFPTLDSFGSIDDDSINFNW